MSDDGSDGGRLPLSRRQAMLIMAGAGSAGLTAVAEALDADGERGSLFGGTMALSKAFNVAQDLYVGPDSAKSNVDANSGRLFIASDTGAEYYGDGGSWVLRDAQFQSINAARYPDPADGTDGIQDAYNDLPSGGGLIVLQEGRYVASDGHQYPDSLIKIDDPSKPVAIVGQGYDSEIFVPDNYQDADTDGMRVIDVGGNTNDPWLSSDTYVDGCLFRSFRVNANQQNNNGDGDGNTISNANDGHNIEIYGSDNKVIGVWSNNATGDGVEITRDDGSSESDTGSNLVLGCTFRDCWEQNVHIHGGTSTVVAYNWMDGEVNNGCLHLFNADNAESTRAIIQGNLITNGQGYGAKLTGSDTSDKNPDAHEISFVNNMVWGHTNGGVLVDSRNIFDLEIKNNWIFNNGGSGVEVDFGADRLDIIGNRIYDNDQNGIGVVGESDGSGVGGPITDLRIERNLIRDNNQSDAFFYGVQINDKDGVAVTRLLIRDNDIIGDGAGAGAHKAPFNFSNDGTGDHSGIEVVRNTDRGNQNSGFQNLVLTLSAIRDNNPPIPVDVRNDVAHDTYDYSIHDGSGAGVQGPAWQIGSNVFYSNGVAESANAETPQGTYAAGQIVFFTDSGDGSGTGTYVIDNSGNPQGAL